VTELRNAPPKPGRRLPSIFDGVPPSTPLSLSDLESLMQADTERRILVVLNHVFAAHTETQPPEPTEPT